MAAKKETKQEPTLVEVLVDYSAGVKANLGDYESADIHVSESERWDVTGLGDEEVEHLRNERYDLMKERLDERVTSFYLDNSKHAR